MIYFSYLLYNRLKCELAETLQRFTQIYFQSKQQPQNIKEDLGDYKSAVRAVFSVNLDVKMNEEVIIIFF